MSLRAKLGNLIPLSLRGVMRRGNLIRKKYTFLFMGLPRFARNDTFLFDR